VGGVVTSLILGCVWGGDCLCTSECVTVCVFGVCDMTVRVCAVFVQVCVCVSECV